VLVMCRPSGLGFLIQINLLMTSACGRRCFARPPSHTMSFG
jgi:hypothetical protein